jgi:hypothetical protein
VPASVLTSKQGFGVPWRSGPGPLRHRLDALLDDDGPTLVYTDRVAVARIRSEHLSGRRDHAAMLWRLLSLDIWLRGHLGSSPESRTDVDVAAPVAEVRTVRVAGAAATDATCGGPPEMDSGGPPHVA